MKIIYISRDSFFLKKILETLKFRIEFIDDNLQNNKINYTNDNDYIQKSNNIKPVLNTLLNIFKKNIIFENNDLIEPDFVLERGFIYNLQEIIDKKHIIKYLNKDSESRIIIVRHLRELFLLKKNNKTVNLKIL